MDHAEIVRLLTCGDPAAWSDLQIRSDRVRHDRVGDEVHLRGLVEISNWCVRSCHYCGIARFNQGLSRYRLTRSEIVDAARLAQTLGYGSTVLQSGEDPQLTRGFIRDVVTEIKETTGLAVTLSLGERSRDDLEAWRSAGADRYLLRFETSNSVLYQRIHPPLRAGEPDRFELLKWVKDAGYEAGSGIMVGIPGQTVSDVATDLLLFRELDLDMIGLGPYIPHPGTPLGETGVDPGAADQVPNSEAMTLVVLALARLLCPDSNMPATTALATLNRRTGLERALQHGANVVMPDLTPQRFQSQYEIYPGRGMIPVDDVMLRHRELLSRLEAIGRRPGNGRGDSVAHLRRRDAH